MKTYKTLFATERGEFHQQRALTSAPPELDILLLRSPTADEIVEAAPDTVYLISERTGVIGGDLIARLPELRLILRLGSMTYDIDMNAARDAGVVVCYQPNVGVIRVAEHIMMQMLTVGKKLYEVGGVAREASDEWGESHRTDEDTFAYNWSNRQGLRQLYDRTVGILGFGEIGAELARRLIGWGCEVLYNKRRQFPQSVEAELEIQYMEKDALISQSDYLVNLLPYFPATDQSLNADTFAAMKDGTVLVSAGSGSVIDEVALADAVRTGKLHGAALDTYEWEPLRPSNPLRKLALEGANVVLTPHTAAGSYTAQIEDRERLEDFANILRHIRGEPNRNRIV